MKNIFALCYILVAVVEIYGAEWCPYCRKSEKLLKDNKIEYIMHEVSNDRYERAQFLQKKFNSPFIPQIIIKGQNIGGYDNLRKLIESKEIHKMIIKFILMLL